MPTFYRIDDELTSDPFRYVVTWNTLTGEVLTTTTTESSGLDFGSSAAQAAAITKINNCVANTGKFIGHVPTPHH